MVRTHPADDCLPNCFTCKVRSLSFSLGSVGGVLQGPSGKSAFHGDHPDGGTNKERFDTMVKAAGGKQNVEPVGARWV